MMLYNSIPASMESAGFITLITWINVVPTLSPRNLERSRLLAFSAIASVSTWNVLCLRSSHVLQSISIGLNAVLSIVYAANFILLHDIRDIRRIQERRAPGTDSKPNGKGPDDPHSLILEGLPPSLPARIAWTFDLITSPRGSHWAWSSNEAPKRLANWKATYHAQGIESGLFGLAVRFLFAYVIIDITKCLMLSDPYFNGIDTDAAPAYLAGLVTSSFALYTYRFLLALLGVTIAIEIEYSLAKVVYVGILGPLGLVNAVNASLNAFPPIWGSPSAVLRKGIRGFWGETWHQIFRRHFGSVGDAVARICSGQTDHNQARRSKPGLDTNGTKSLYARATIVFLLSGLLHAAASNTLRGPTRPWRSFTSFALQPLGMIVQSACSSIFVKRGLLGSVGRNTVIRQSCNLAFALIWLRVTMDFVLEDLTRGQMWMIEPVPISVIHGLNFMKDSTWWRW